MSSSSPAVRLFPAGPSRRFFFGIIAVLSLLYPVYRPLAQTEIKLSGRVIDAISGSPVQAAAVSVEGYGRTVATDADGYFYFTDLPAGDYEIRASRIGYRQKIPSEVAVDGAYQSDITILMVRSPVLAGSQTVTADRRGNLHISRSGLITTVDIIEPGSNSIERLVEALPELELVESSGRRFLRMRGAALNATFILIDGRLLNSSLDSRADISAVPFESVSKVEVAAGGDYRTPGLAGSVNFVTGTIAKNAIAAAERGSFDHERYALGGELSFKNEVALSLNGHSAYERGDFEFTDPRDSVQTRDNNFEKSSGLFGTFRYSRGKSSIKISSRYFKRIAGVPGAVFQPTPNALSESEEVDISGAIEKRFLINNTINLNIGSIERRAEFDSPRTPTNFIPYNTLFKERNREAKLGFIRSGRFDFNAILGIRYEMLEGEDLIRPSSSLGTHSRTINSVAAGVDCPFGLPYAGRRKSNLTIGARQEWGPGGNILLPSAALRLNPDTPIDIGFDISYSRGRRLPDMADLYWKEDVFATPNPGLRPEKSRSLQAGLDFRNRVLGMAILRISGFTSDYKDIIIWRKWAGDKFKPVNLSEARIDGWEVSVDFSPFNGPIRLAWTGSFLRPLNKEDEPAHHNKYLTFRPIGTQTAVIELAYGRFEIRVKGRHIGRRYTTEENTKSLPPVDPVDCDVRMKLNIMRVKALVEFAISNIGDIQYEILDRQPEKPREFRAKLTISSKGDPS